jgi:hypothetical protein
MGTTLPDTHSYRRFYRTTLPDYAMPGYMVTDYAKLPTDKGEARSRLFLFPFRFYEILGKYT